ncbi:MAG: hypothetical protein WA960_14865 [Tunicatimonas sp.]
MAQSIPKKISAAQSALYNASAHSDIKARLKKYGMTPEEIKKGTVLLNKVLMQHHQKDDCYGEKKDLAVRIAEQTKETRERFSRHVSVVKFAFADQPTVAAKLKVERLSKKQDDWQAQATYFYLRVVDYLDTLKDYKLTAEELAQNQANLDALVALRNRRKQLKGDAEEATRSRDLSLRALRLWMKEFYGIARVALADKPQLLEVLGIKVKSERIS